MSCAVPSLVLEDTATALGALLLSLLSYCCCHRSESPGLVEDTPVFGPSLNLALLLTVIAVRTRTGYFLSSEPQLPHVGAGTNATCF